jgi:hypothetical protein
MNRFDAMLFEALDGDVSLGGTAAALGIDDQEGAAGHRLSHEKA